MSQQRGSTKVDAGSELLRLSLEQELEIKYQLEEPKRLYQFAYPQIIWRAGLEPANTSNPKLESVLSLDSNLFRKQITKNCSSHLALFNIPAIGFFSGL